PPGGAPGGCDRVIQRASWAGTAIFAVTAIAAAVAPETFKPLALATAVVLFAGGCGIFLWAFFLVAARSRTDQMELAQIWFLTGPPTPPEVRRSLLGALAVQVVIGVATAGVRPYTSLAAGVLVPRWGLGLCGLWAARHGVFPARPADPRRPGPGLRSPHADRREQDP
ncbi:MAG: hypothetical protein Q8K72_10905, partial [Acidimicrobiales bacterium]|nr:hypothetical protein [Acidimicrobiales bacterium]